MFPIGLWKLLHLFFAFSYVGSLVVAEWNGRAARATNDWSQRALLYQIAHLSSRIAGFGGLIMLGIFGNVLAVRSGYSMSQDTWLMWVNGLWLAAVLSMALLSVRYSGQLATTSKLAAEGGVTTEYSHMLARWRFGNVLQSVLYLTLLVLMVLHWKHS